MGNYKQITRNILFILLLGFITNSCKKETVSTITPPTPPVKTTDPEPEITPDAYIVSITVETPSEENLDSLLTNEYSYTFKEGSLSNNNSRNVLEEIELESIFRTNIINLQTHEIPMSTYHISIEKTEGENLDIEDFSIEIEELPEWLKLSNLENDGSNGLRTNDNSIIEFVKDATNLALSQVSFQIKTDSSAVPSDQNENIKGVIKNSENLSILEFKQSIKSINRNIALNVITISAKSFSQSYNIERTTISQTSGDSDPSEFEAINIDRIHTITKDNCPQFLGSFLVHIQEDTLVEKYLQSHSNQYIFTELEKGTGINSNAISTSSEIDPYFGQAYLFNFTCSPPEDVSTLFFINVKVEDITTNTVITIFKIPVSIDVTLESP